MAGKPIVISIVGDNRGLRGTLGDSESRLTRFGRTAARVGTRGALAVGAGLVAIGVASTRSASAAQQSLGATETVFGKFADTVIRRSNDAATAVGLSANEYRELANVMGASLAGAGIPLERVTTLTDKLNTRAADLAATFGGSTREAVEAMGSLLRGEADPIERYGISIKQADVNARLAAKGLDKLTGEERKQAEMTARLDLLMQKSARSAGAFRKESNTLANRQQVLGAKIENVRTKFGNLLLPALTRGADLIIDRVVPATEDLAEWLSTNTDEIQSFGGSVKDTLLPPLKVAGDLITGVGKVFTGLPGPVQTAALQAGLFALVMPRVTAGIASVSASATIGIARLRQFGAEMTYSATRGAAVSSALTRVGGAARSAAGVGGMVALTQGMSSTNKATGVLLTTLGAAATGFAVGGPVGAAVGGLAGLVGGLATRTKKAATATDTGRAAWQTYGATLDGITGKITAATREMARSELQKKGLLSVTRSLGISDRDAVNAVVRGGPARQRLAAAINAEQKALRDKYEALIKEHGVSSKQARAFSEENHARAVNLQKVEDEIGVVQEAIEEKRRLRIATADLGKEYNKLPEHVRTRVEAHNFRPTFEGVKDLIRQYDGKLDKRTIRTIVTAAGVPTTRAQLAALDAYANHVARTRTLTVQLQTQGTLPFVGEASTPRQAGRAAEDSLGRQAAAAGRLATNLGTAGRGISALSDKHRQLLATLQNTARSGYGAIVESLRSYLKAQGLNAAQASRFLQNHRGLLAAMVANARAQQVINTRLAAAREHLANLRQQHADYASTVRESFKSFSSAVGLGAVEDGSVKIGNLLDQLRDKAVAASRFADLIRRLTAHGLNKTSIEQLLAAGVEGGLATAEAIASGGSAAISEINSLTAQITSTGAALGNQAANTMYGAGIQAAEGLVAGLQAQQSALAAVADQLALTLVNAIKSRLGIKSPSRVAKALARDFTDGLTIETYSRTRDVAKAGEATAKALVRGFDRPQLNATAAATGFGPGGQTVINLNVTVPPTANKAEIGREIQAALDAYYRAGGRIRA